MAMHAAGHRLREDDLAEIRATGTTDDRVQNLPDHVPQPGTTRTSQTLTSRVKVVSVHAGNVVRKDVPEPGARCIRRSLPRMVAGNLQATGALSRRADPRSRR